VSFFSTRRWNCGRNIFIFIYLEAEYFDQNNKESGVSVFSAMHLETLY
jgi:hypothetical protein